MDKPLIIIADPHGDRAEALEAALPDCDCLVLETTEAALREAGHRQPAAVILDFPFPTGDGRCLSAALSQDPRTARIPLIAYSSWNFARTRARAEDFGCDAFVPHRDGPEAVARMVAEVLDGRSRSVA